MGLHCNRDIASVNPRSGCHRHPVMSVECLAVLGCEAHLFITFVKHSWLLDAVVLVKYSVSFSGPFHLIVSTQEGNPAFPDLCFFQVNS